MTLAETIAAGLEADGWTVDHDGLAALDTDLRMAEPDAISALMNPFRIGLLTSLSRRPASVKELSAQFDVPPTRLYHHLGLLEEYGAVRVVGTRRSGARTERCYGAVRGGIAPDPDLLANHPEAMADSVVKMVALAGEAFGAAVRTGRIALSDQEDSEGEFAWIAPRLTSAQRRMIEKELEDLAERIGELSSQNRADEVPDCEPTIILLLVTPDVTAPT